MTGEEYARALERMEVLIAVDPAPDSIYGRELLRLGALIEAYERKQFPAMFPGSQPQEDFDAAD